MSNMEDELTKEPWLERVVDPQAAYPLRSLTAKSPGRHGGWQEDFVAFPLGLGWKVTFQGRVLLNWGGGVDVCKNQLMELMVS